MLTILKAAVDSFGRDLSMKQTPGFLPPYDQQALIQYLVDFFHLKPFMKLIADVFLFIHWAILGLKYPHPMPPSM